MTGVPPYSVGELTAQPGTQARGWCPVSLGPATVSLPIAITHGARPGPVLAVTAGIHGGEYVPMVAARQFVRGLEPADMRGTVVVSLQSSPVAFEQRRAFVNPLDGQNLNRSFPGDPDGGPTAPSWPTGCGGICCLAPTTTSTATAVTCPRHRTRSPPSPPAGMAS
jgi:uncharacterized protein